MNSIKKIILLIATIFILKSNVFSAAYSVTSLSDALIAGTLRTAITTANGIAGPHTITFNITGTVVLTSSLPSIIQNITFTNAAALGTVTIDAGNSAIPFHLNFTAAACAGSIVEKLVFNNGGTGAAILIQSPAVSITIRNNRIGTNAAGTAAIRQITGIQVTGAANGNHSIDNNLISGCVSEAVLISNSINNTISNNYMGLDVTGTNSIPMGRGLNMNNNSNYNTINNNVISASGNAGIELNRSSYNTIRANYIGTDKTGLLPRGNAWDGIGLIDRSNYNMIGGTSVADRNICCAGTSGIASGIAIKSGGGAGLTSSYNTILNNYCGVGADGTTALGNANYGIYIGYDNGTQNIVGKPGFGNVVAYNLMGAVILENSGSQNNSIRGNSIYCNGPGSGAATNNIGISLRTASNASVAAPVINASSNSGNVYGSGMASGDTIDIYYTDACRGCTYPNGKTYIATVFANGSGNWSYTGGVTVGSTITATVTKFNASTIAGNTSEFSNCSVIIVLPVSLLSFNANKTSEGVLLTWETTNETDNDYFIIERSFDGIHFEAIGKIKGNGNSNNSINYSFLDNSAYEEISYYRLKQIDFNGAFDYSTIISVTTNFVQSMVLFPSPINSGSDLQLLLNGINEDDVVTIEIYDAIGKIISSQTSKGSFHKLSTTEFAKGFYTLAVKSKSNFPSKKFLVN